MKKYTTLFPLALIAASFGLRAETLSSTTKDHVIVKDKTFEMSISQEKIAQRVKELAAQIDQDYKGKKPVLVGVLTGAFMFLSDLVKEMNIDCEIDFIKLSSYGASTRSSGTINVSKKLSHDISNRDVILVEDIIDSGLTITYAREMILQQNPASLRIASFLDKNLSTKDFPIDYVAFNIAPEFVVGYGLDYDQEARGLKDLYKLAE